MKENNINEVFGIRRIVGDMPFDRDGIHATGREILQYSHVYGEEKQWYTEYEDWDTTELDTTESEEEYEARVEAEFEVRFGAEFD